MLEKYFVRPQTVDRIRASWIGPQIERYVAWLAERGYGARSVLRRVPLLAAFGEFARLNGARSLADLPGHVDAFVDKRVGESRDARRGLGQTLAKDIRGPVKQLLELVVPGFGELAAPFLRRWPVWPTMTGIVLGWGLALIPLGLRTPLWAGLAAFCAGAVIWGPWTSLSMAVFQDASPPAALAQVIAARSALLILATPLGTALGGPILAALSARGTLLASALATIALGVLTVAALARARARARKAGTSG